MNRMKVLLTLSALTVMPMTVMADQQTVILKVGGMSCVSCSYQVKSALKKVEGVMTTRTSPGARQSEINFEVTFDDAITNIAALTQATTNAGFPSTLKP